MMCRHTDVRFSLRFLCAHAGRYTPRYIGTPERLPYRQQASVQFNFVHGGWIVV